MLRAAILIVALALGATAPPAPPPSGAAPPPCVAQTFEGARFWVCRYDPTTERLRLANRDAGGRPLDNLPALQAWLGPDADHVAFAMNAGMYDTGQQPLGLYIADGREQHPLNRRTGDGNFYLAPNGVFWVGVDGAAHVTETAAFAARPGGVAWATQSGPLLVAGGAFNPHIAADGVSLNIRNAVGVSGGGSALFVISDDKVSFGRLARFLRDGLGCQDALYLDGAVSSLWAPGWGRLDGRRGLGTFVVVLRRP